MECTIRFEYGETDIPQIRSQLKFDHYYLFHNYLNNLFYYLYFGYLTKYLPDFESFFVKKFAEGLIIVDSSGLFLAKLDLENYQSKNLNYGVDFSYLKYFDFSAVDELI